MRILALEVESQDAAEEDFLPFLAAEALKVWQLQQDDIIREIYFHRDRHSAVLMLECDSVEVAKRELSELPLVSAGLIEFDFIPLVPYPGFARLFAQ